MNDPNNVPKPIRENHHRLPEAHYLGRTVAYTLCLSERRPLLNNAFMFEGLYPLLVEASRSYRCHLIICVLMPDHLHCILSGHDQSSDPLSAIKRFKQRSGFWMKRVGSKACWQKSFYDHIIRENESLNRQIKYVLMNPIRAEITTHWRDYPWKGSTVYDLNEWEDVL